MKRFITFAQILLLSFVLLLSGCGCGKTTKTNNDDTGTSPCVYYINESGTDLVAEPITPPETARSNQLEFMIAQLISPPAGKISPLPEGTTLNSVSIKDDIAVIDFSAAFSQSDNVKQTLAPAAVAQTLCTLDFISGVQILVDGTDAIGADGKPLGVIRENDLVINKGSTPTQAPKTTLVLYFSDENSEFLVAERRNIDIYGGDTVEKLIVEELILGPTEGGNIKTIPAETKILSIETKDKVCFVNLSKEFVDKHSGGTTSEMLTVYSIVNSLTELSTVERVQFLIEGEKREEFISMIFNEPIVRNPSMIKK